MSLARERELQKYPVDEPIFVFLRQLKRSDLNAYSEIMFFFGEMDDTDKNFFHSMWWCINKKHMKTIRKAFTILSPTCEFDITDYGDDEMLSFRVRWKEINPIVFNKILFPDFSIVPKESMEW